MPLTTRHPGRWSWRALLPWGVGVLPLLCGGLVVHWQVQADLRASSQATAAQLVNQVDHMLDALAAAARTVLPLAGKPCRDIELILRQQVIRNAFVRSANLVYQDRLYCSSLLGATDEPVDPASYADGRLWLMAGNDVTPGHALLVYRAREQARGALVALDGQHLQIVLGLLGGKAQLAVRWLANGSTNRVGFTPASHRRRLWPRCEWPRRAIRSASTPVSRPAWRPSACSITTRPCWSC